MHKQCEMNILILCIFDFLSCVMKLYRLIWTEISIQEKKTGVLASWIEISIYYFFSMYPPTA